MSIGIRGFVEFLVKQIENEGVLGSGYDDSERENDVINMIWESYNKYSDND